VLAASNRTLVLVTLSRALSARFDRHRAIARVTLADLVCMSPVTGVIVYWMLYQL
jgi:uncharacterized membrane protein YozB (DUF420 family)